MQKVVCQAAIWVAAGVTFFLSLWIVLPGFNMFFLTLAVGAPEVSPLLGLIALVLLALTLRLYSPKRLFSARGRRLSAQWPARLLVVMLLATLALSSLPLLQQPSMVAAANRSMAIAFPHPTPAAVTTKPTFSWLNFIGVRAGEISAQNVRYRGQIPFASPDNQPLFLDVYQPPEVGEYPAVVTVYGGSWREGSPAGSEQIGRYLAARGYVVVAVDYRHTPEYRFPAQLEDVQAALAFVSDRAAEYEILSDFHEGRLRPRIGLLGWSAGAHLAMLTGFQSSQIRSIVDYYGPVDLAAGYADPPSPDPIDVRQVLLAFMGGPPSQLPEAYAAASPITYVKSAQPNTLPPVLLIYGGRDHLVESRFGKRLYDALIKSQNTAVWVKIPWAEHAFDKLFNGVSNQVALHFVERFLYQTLVQ